MLSQGFKPIMVDVYDNDWASAIRDENQITRFNLQQNYHNPFNPVTSIRYGIPERSSVILKVYDILGREVSILVNEEKYPGRYEVKFDASSLSSGIYFSE